MARKVANIRVWISTLHMATHGPTVAVTLTKAPRNLPCPLSLLSIVMLFHPVDSLCDSGTSNMCSIARVDCTQGEGLGLALNCVLVLVGVHMCLWWCRMHGVSAVVKWKWVVCSCSAACASAVTPYPHSSSPIWSELQALISYHPSHC